MRNKHKKTFDNFQDIIAQISKIFLFSHTGQGNLTKASHKDSISPNR